MTHPTPINDFLSAQATAGVEFHSLTVIRHGDLLTQLAAHPWSLERPSLVYSMTKTFTSAAFGIVWDQGLLTPETRLVEVFPELVDDRVGPKARTITLGHCLAMASGHTIDTIALTQGRQALRLADLRSFLRLEPEGIPGETFAYNQLCSYAISRAIHRVTGHTVAKILRSHVLNPLGVGPVHWVPDIDGVPIGFSGLHIAPVDLASFIALLLNDGVAGDTRLLPRRWLDTYSRCHVATDPTSPNPDWGQGYGWHVWQGVEGHRADGAYGQYGLLYPERGVACTITSATEDMQPTIDQVAGLLLDHLDELGAPPEVAVPTPEGPGPSASWEGTDERGGIIWLTPAADGWDLTWQDADCGHHLVHVGHGRWSAGRMYWPKSHQFPGGSSATVYCAGIQHPDGSAEIRMAFVDTPHTATVHLAGTTARLLWLTQPLGGTYPQHISLPLGWGD